MARHLRQPVAPRANAPDTPVSTRGAYGDEVPPGLLKPRNGAGRAALICGLLAFVFAVGFFLLVTVPLAIVLALLGIVLGFVGHSRVRRGLATNPGSASAGIVMSILSLVILAGLTVAGVALFNGHKQEVRTLRHCVHQAGFNSNQLRDCVTQFKNQVTE